MYFISFLCNKIRVILFWKTSLEMRTTVRRNKPLFWHTRCGCLLFARNQVYLHKQYKQRNNSRRPLSQKILSATSMNTQLSIRSSIYLFYNNKTYKQNRTASLPWFFAVFSWNGIQRVVSLCSPRGQYTLIMWPGCHIHQVSWAPFCHTMTLAYDTDTASCALVIVMDN